MKLQSRKLAAVSVSAVAALAVASGVAYGASTGSSTWKDVNTGPRVAVSADVDFTGTATEVQQVFQQGTSDFVVPTGQKFVITGISGRGVTGLGDAFSSLMIDSTGGPVLFQTSPTATTPGELSAGVGSIYNWGVAAPLNVAVTAGEKIRLYLDRDLGSAFPSNDPFAVTLVGYMVAG